MSRIIAPSADRIRAAKTHLARLICLAHIKLHSSPTVDALDKNFTFFDENGMQSIRSANGWTTPADELMGSAVDAALNTIELDNNMTELRLAIDELEFESLVLPTIYDEKTCLVYSNGTLEKTEILFYLDISLDDKSLSMQNTQIIEQWATPLAAFIDIQQSFSIPMKLTIVEEDNATSLSYHPYIKPCQLRLDEGVLILTSTNLAQADFNALTATLARLQLMDVRVATSIITHGIFGIVEGITNTLIDSLRDYFVAKYPTFGSAKNNDFIQYAVYEIKQILLGQTPKSLKEEK